MNTQIQTLYGEAVSCLKKRQLKKAKNIIRIALDFCGIGSTSLSDLASLHLLLAKVHVVNAKYQDQISHLHDAKDQVMLAEQLCAAAGDESLYTQSLLVKSELLAFSGEFGLAEDILFKCLSVTERKKCCNGLMLALSELSGLNLLSHEVERGIAFAEDAYRNLNANNDHCSDDARTEVYLQLSNSYTLTNHVDALEIGMWLLRLSTQTGDVEKIAIANHNIATAYQASASYEKSIQHFTESFAISEAIGFRRLSIKNAEKIEELTSTRRSDCNRLYANDR